MKSSCATCGQPHPRCSAHNRAKGPCGRWPIDGANVCDHHGGKSPQVLAKAAVVVEVRRWGLGGTDVDPGEMLLRLLSQSAARVQDLSAEIESLVDESPTLRDALVGTAQGEWGPTGEYIRGLAQLEAAERDRCATFAAKAIAAGLAERTVRLAERQGALIADLMRKIVDDPELGLTPEQRRAFPVVAERVLALVG